MSKAVMISIRPKWCELISIGQKTLEIRKTAPKLSAPFKCYIYMTAGNASIKMPKGTHHHSGGKCVIGEFTCKKIVPIKVFPNGTIQNWNFHELYNAYIPYDEMAFYIGADQTGYGWEISSLMIYDKPKEVSEFIRLRQTKFGGEALTLTRPPQSWCYVEGGKNDG